MVNERSGLPVERHFRLGVIARQLGVSVPQLKTILNEKGIALVRLSQRGLRLRESDLRRFLDGCKATSP